MPHSATTIADAERSAARHRRHFHKPSAAYCTALLVLLASAGMAGFIFFVGKMLATTDRLMGIYALAGLGVYVLATALRMPLSRALHCQLCHGTVLRDSGSRKHRQSSKVPLLTHRFCTALKIVFCARFQCMYCGTGFKLKK